MKPSSTDAVPEPEPGTTPDPAPAPAAETAPIETTPAETTPVETTPVETTDRQVTETPVTTTDVPAAAAPPPPAPAASIPAPRSPAPAPAVDLAAAEVPAAVVEAPVTVSLTAAVPESTSGFTPARFDIPLSPGRLGTPRPPAGWAHPSVQARIEVATDAARTQARSLGYATGWAEGRKAAAAAAEAQKMSLRAENRRRLATEGAQLRRAVEAFAEAARSAERAAVPAWEEVADALVDGAMAIARAALGRELATVSPAVLDMLRTALHRLGDPQDCTAHLNPQDIDIMSEVPGITLPAGLKLVPDPDVPQGGALVQTPSQRLRMALPDALAAAEEVLRS